MRLRPVEENGVKKRVRKRLNTLDADEVVRWADMTSVAVGLNVGEIRKSLAHDDVDQARAYMEETKKGAWAILAAMESLELKYPKG